MPPKKKRNERTEPSEARIINMYDVMPKQFLDASYNPNFHLHRLKLPLRMCIIAPSGSGKTNFLVNLLHMFSCGEGTFQSIHIITRNRDEPLYRWLMAQCPQISITEGLETTPELDKFDKKVNHLVVFDDLVLSKDLSKVEQYWIRGRKLSCSVIFISQSYFRIPKIIRNNCSYMVLLKLSGQREVNLILSEFGLGITKEQLLDAYRTATAEKLQPLLIDLEADPPERFRKGVSEIIEIR